MLFRRCVCVPFLSTQTPYIYRGITIPTAEQVLCQVSLASSSVKIWYMTVCNSEHVTLGIYILYFHCSSVIILFCSFCSGIVCTYAPVH